MAMALMSAWWAAQQPMWTRMTTTLRSSPCARLLYVSLLVQPQSYELHKLTCSDSEVAASGMRQMAFVCAVIACNSWDKAWCHTQLTYITRLAGFCCQGPRRWIWYAASCSAYMPALRASHYTSSAGSAWPTSCMAPPSECNSVYPTSTSTACNVFAWLAR